MTSKAPSPLWTFSLEIYSSEAVQKACLELQDGSGVDVNILLYVLWLAKEGRRISAAEARELVAQFEPWRAEVVVPLRSARRALRLPAPVVEAEAAQSLRNMVKKVELEAERLQQEALHAWRAPAGPGSPEASRQAAASANVEAYGAALGRGLAPAPLAVMISALMALA